MERMVWTKMRAQMMKFTGTTDSKYVQLTHNND